MPYELSCPTCLRTHRINLIVSPAAKWLRRAEERAYRRHSARHVESAIKLRLDALRHTVRRRHPGAKRKNFLAAVAAAWRVCAREAESNPVPIRRQRLEGLHAQGIMLMGTHPKCRSCRILFGPGHEFLPHSMGLCEWCCVRREAQRRIYGGARHNVASAELTSSSITTP